MEFTPGMSELARTMPAYVDHKTFTADDGERVTVVTFADEASQDAWRTQVDHREAQRAGVRDYYACFGASFSSSTSDSSSHSMMQRTSLICSRSAITPTST